MSCRRGACTTARLPPYGRRSRASCRDDRPKDVLVRESMTSVLAEAASSAHRTGDFGHMARHRTALRGRRHSEALHDFAWSSWVLLKTVSSDFSRDSNLMQRPRVSGPLPSKGPFPACSGRLSIAGADRDASLPGPIPRRASRQPRAPDDAVDAHHLQLHRPDSLEHAEALHEPKGLRLHLELPC